MKILIKISYNFKNKYVNNNNNCTSNKITTYYENFDSEGAKFYNPVINLKTVKKIPKNKSNKSIRIEGKYKKFEIIKIGSLIKREEAFISRYLDPFGIAEIKKMKKSQNY